MKANMPPIPTSRLTNMAQAGGMFAASNPSVQPVAAPRAPSQAPRPRRLYRKRSMARACSCCSTGSFW